jgi:hypothetical protein
MKNLKKFLSNSIVNYQLKESLNYIVIQNISLKLINLIINNIKEIKYFSLNKLKLKCLNLNTFLNLKILKFPLNLFFVKSFDDIKIFLKSNFNFIKLIKKKNFFFDFFSFSKLMLFSLHFYIIFLKNNILKIIKLQFFKKLAKLKINK